MIYIFDGVRSICSLPGLCCKACGDCCSAINCKPIKDCCDSCGKGCTHFMERPLSTFVIVSFILSGVGVYFGYTSLSSDCKFKEDVTIGHSMWVMIELVFAVVNIIFALYFQHKVWNNILSKKDEFMAEVSQDSGNAGLMANVKGGVKNLRGQLGGAQNTEPEEPPPKDEKIKVKPESVQASFKEVFLQDFGVLAYFFGLIAVCVISYMGHGYFVSEDQCMNENFVYYIGLAYFGIAFTYTFLWYCCKCCAGTVTLEKDEISEGDMA